MYTDGLVDMKIEVVQYNPDWPDKFIAEKLLLEEHLGAFIDHSHHIGSTAVSGLAAKPIIDIIIEVEAVDLLDRFTPVMASLFYEAKGEFGIPGRRYFRKGGDCRTHQIHAYKTGDLNVHRHIAFRDYLIAHAEVKQAYANLKMELANIFNIDIERYCEGKDEFVKYHELKALEWANRD